jgi:hypothetical protein
VTLDHNFSWILGQIESILFDEGVSHFKGRLLKINAEIDYNVIVTLFSCFLTKFCHEKKFKTA